MIGRFLAARGAATSLEYAMVAGMVSIVIVVACTSIGTKLNTLYFGPLMTGIR